MYRKHTTYQQREQENLAVMERRQQLNGLNAQLRNEDYIRQAGMANLSSLVAQADNRTATVGASVARALAVQNAPIAVAPDPEVFRFVIGVEGLETSISYYYTNAEFWKEDLPSNVSWEHVTVRTEADADAWIAAKNAYLCAAWTPNQNDEERAANKMIMNEAIAEMGRLEIPNA